MVKSQYTKDKPVRLSTKKKKAERNTQCHLVKNISFVKKAINYDTLFCVMCRTI